MERATETSGTCREKVLPWLSYILVTKFPSYHFPVAFHFLPVLVLLGRREPKIWYWSRASRTVTHQYSSDLGNPVPICGYEASFPLTSIVSQWWTFFR